VYEFAFHNAWLDAKNGTSKTVAPTGYRAGGPRAGKDKQAPTMPAAEEGKANYRLEIATGPGADG
jgi:lipoxygenase homology domain-containing protein 1